MGTTTTSTASTTTATYDSSTGKMIYSGDSMFIPSSDLSNIASITTSTNLEDNDYMKYLNAMTPDYLENARKNALLYVYVNGKDSSTINFNIKEVNILVPNKVVEVVFEDGTKEKAVCQEPDVFSFEMAIGICISKKIMGGSSAYNNAIRKGVKIYEKQEKAKAEEEKRKVAAERKRKKRIEKKQKKAELKKDAEKREKIEIQREAYIQAMEYMEHRKNCK